jgi:hypothetical protein
MPGAIYSVPMKQFPSGDNGKSGIHENGMPGIKLV